MRAVKLGKEATEASKASVDTKLSLTSTNPVQNKVVTKAIYELEEQVKNIPNTEDFATIDEVEVIVNEKIDTNIESIDIETIKNLFR